MTAAKKGKCRQFFKRRNKTVVLSIFTHAWPKCITAYGRGLGSGVTPRKLEDEREWSSNREQRGGRAGTGWKEEGGFQRHSSVLTGAKHGKLD